MTEATAEHWKSGWSVEQPVEFDFSWDPYDAAVWKPGAAPGLVSRDLGLAKASKNVMAAVHTRVAGDPAKILLDWRCHDLDFQFIYVLKGQVRLENAHGETHILTKGGVATQPAFLRYKLDRFSDDFEMVEIVGPGKFDTIHLRNAPLPKRAVAFAGAKGLYLSEMPDSFKSGAGPRSYFSYRDLCTAPPTGGRIYIHVPKALPPVKPGGTGWHNHNMRQWFFVLSGSALIEMQVDGKVHPYTVKAFDAMTVHKGQKHDAASYTADYSIIEMCIPTVYNTVTVERPA